MPRLDPTASSGLSPPDRRPPSRSRPLKCRHAPTQELGEVTRLGEPGNARAVDVRIIAATHRDLRQAVIEGSFRT
jgi:hypothetical protein